MKAFTALIVLFNLLISTSSFSQECQVEGKKDWEKVEIRTYVQVQEPLGYTFLGEAILAKVTSNSIDRLSPKHIREIKEKVAEDGACVVYVDFNNLMQIDYGLYYVWTDEGVTKVE